MRWLSRTTILIGLLAVSSCARNPTGPSDPAAALALSRGRWIASGISSYRYTLFRACECPPGTAGPVVIEVNGGTVTARTFAASGSPVDVQYAAEFPTVPGLFDVIQDALDRDAAGLAVRYDSDFGYPASIQIDYVSGVADDEVTYRVSGFEPLP